MKNLAVIEERILSLVRMCRKEDMPMLAYLLEMAALEINQSIEEG